MTRCLIALGGNVGVSQAIYDSAMSELEAAGIHVTGRSTAILTRPVGHHAGDTFWNAAATLEYDQSADQLLQLLHEIRHFLQRALARVELHVVGRGAN